MLKDAIETYVSGVDNPYEIVQYRLQTLQTSSSGMKLKGVEPDILDTIALDEKKPIVSPVQVIRQPGLGDRIFALAATYAYKQQHPKTRVTFQATKYDAEWLSWLPFIKVGLDKKAKTVINFDNLSANIGDRATAMADVIDVKLPSLQFPINIPKNVMSVPDKPYYVFVPFASRRGPRSLHRAIIDSVLLNTDLQLVLIDTMPYETKTKRVINMSAKIGFPELFTLIQESAGVIGVDTGPLFVSLAMGKPTMALFSHVGAKNRILAAQNVTAYDSVTRCAPCGDHISSRPSCKFEDEIALCMQHYTVPFLLYAMKEFAKTRGEET